MGYLFLIWETQLQAEVQSWVQKLCSSVLGPNFLKYQPLVDSNHGWLHLLWTSSYIWGYVQFWHCVCVCVCFLQPFLSA